ncbi:ABC transporter permease [Pseudonocardia sp. MH-G8]|uniref:ABC transporter permease n=1 Tax=Pseudonocardia sp. MH-G8 TaxID=1854588 RepID=UPI000BA05678|nr:ABC transporter permease [Pseudonocardia sp. MH-G8]OZM77962.1 peptide ABC transporter permease [Pseudonocardia sp. MH-G8]
MSSSTRPVEASTDGLAPAPRATSDGSPRQRTWRAFRSNPLGVGSVLALVFTAVVAVAAPLIADEPRGYGTEVLAPPSARHWFGTDNLGLDVLAQVVWGARTSVAVGLGASLLAIVLGVAVGVGAAYFRKLDTVLGVLVDLMLSLPVLPLMILVAALVGPSVSTLVVVIAVFSWPEVARVVRSQALPVVTLTYVDAAHVIGAPNRWVLARHVLPAVAPVIAVSVVLTASRAVLSEAGLSFLGLGDPTSWSWGTILYNAQRSGVLGSAWWTALFPSLAILLLVVAATLASLAYNDARNPRTRGDSVR